MRYLKIFVFTLIIFTQSNIAFSKDVYFVDLKRILNESKAGKQAQDFLKKKFEAESKTEERQSKLF